MNLVKWLGDARYSILLDTLLRDKNFELFDFEYKFYEETFKSEFEGLFKDYYRFREIGFETIPRFKHQLKTKLNLIYPKYKQLYESELACKGINFMLNKDLKETYIRDITSSSVNENTSNTNNESAQSGSDVNSNTHKESVLANGLAELSMEDKITGITEDTNTTTLGTRSTDTSTNTAQSNNTGTENEKTELISQGNIGTTSSATLLREWREVQINIMQMVIDECKDLFLFIY